jgi:uncharacterized membrane protein
MIPRAHLFIVILILLADALLSAMLYPHLPARVPTHWNWRGQVDGYGPAWMDALLLPVVSWALMTLLLLAPRLGLLRSNFALFARTYGRICVTLAAALLAIQVIVLFKVLGWPIPIERAMPVVTGLLIAILGNWMGKVRRNGLVGIRTPWTLASDEVWEKTHRLGGRIMFAWGLAVALSAIWAAPLISLAVMMGGAVVLLVWAVVYSYRAYHNLGGSA